jgi:hypothetical protein
MKRDFWLWILVALLTGIAFLYGGRKDNPIYQNVFPPDPTPTPDSRANLGEKIRVNGMDLSLLKAWRVVRPNDAYDLGILEVKFEGTRECDVDGEAIVYPTLFKGEARSDHLCTFQRNSFLLNDGRGNPQQEAPAAMKYIPGIKYIQLSPERELSSLTSEQGQLYFLLDKTVNDFTLLYSSARLKVEPLVYGHDEAIRNISTTPQPRYGIAEE